MCQIGDVGDVGNVSDVGDGDVGVRDVGDGDVGVRDVGDAGLTCVRLEIAPGPRHQQGARIPHIASTSTSNNQLTFRAYDQPHICCSSQLNLKCVTPHIKL